MENRILYRRSRSIELLSISFQRLCPPPTKSSLKSLDDELTLLASKIPKEDVESDEIVMQAPNFEYNSNKTEIPTLRVLKQGDIDLEDQGLKPQHVWWFAKKGNEIAAVMNEDGSLTELTLKCVKWHLAKIQNLKLDFPPTTSNIFIYETSMTRHTKKWRRLWNLSTYQLMKIDLIQVSTSQSHL